MWSSLAVSVPHAKVKAEFISPNQTWGWWNDAAGAEKSVQVLEGTLLQSTEWLSNVKKQKKTTLFPFSRRISELSLSLHWWDIWVKVYMHLVKCISFSISNQIPQTWKAHYSGVKLSERMFNLCLLDEITEELLTSFAVFRWLSHTHFFITVWSFFHGYCSWAAASARLLAIPPQDR